MILSMTGYGRGTVQKQDLTIVSEIKSLNGRASDIRLKSTISLGEKELEIRKFILDHAIRGKMDVSISFDGEMPHTDQAFNVQLIKSYYRELQPVLEELGAQQTDLLTSILRLPNIMHTNQTVTVEVSDQIMEAVVESLEMLKTFRINEGLSIRDDLTSSLTGIEKHLSEIEPYDEDRNAHLKNKLRIRMEEYQKTDHVDQNRFEQEVLYYLEKLDINEEKVRLKQHCDHFREVMNTSLLSKGKKLSFISQEMGREINTMGAKAQWTPIQKHVVSMKNELEKIKEQLANTL